MQLGLPLKKGGIFKMESLIKISEVALKENKLAELAKEIPNKITDIKELDKPIAKEVAVIRSLTSEQKEQIKEQSGYPNEVVDNISCVKEYEIYKDANLKIVVIEDKICLIRDDIHFDQKDSFGRSNKERIEQNLVPISKDGKLIELHHVGQKADSPLAELTCEEHRGKGCDTILHDKSKISEIDRGKFTTERHDYWKNRMNLNERY